jgi:hypothetical protein
MHLFRASPHGYQLYTLPGIEFLLRDFYRVESGIFSGLISGALCALQEVLALVFSFGL